MSKLNFFTPVIYTPSPKSIGSSLLEKVDNYFYLGGKKAQVIPELTPNLNTRRSYKLGRSGGSVCVIS